MDLHIEIISCLFFPFLSANERPIPKIFNSTFIFYSDKPKMKEFWE